MSNCDRFTFSAGHMGDDNAWCYWLTEYPDEGSVGPFQSQEAAQAHADGA